MSSPSLIQLRARIAALEGQAADGTTGGLPLGVTEIDAVLPGGGLSLGVLHEIAPAALGDGVLHGAAVGFAAVCLGRLARQQGRAVLWVTAGDDLYPPGLAALGLDAQRLLVVRPRNAAQAAWVVEEGLHCRGLAAVLGETWGLDGTAARRLQLAARASGVTAFLLNQGAAAAPAVTRWRVAPALGGDAPDHGALGPGRMGLGAWRWRLELCHCRGRGWGEDGIVGSWLVEWNDEARRLRMAAPAGDRPALPVRRRRMGQG